MQNKKIQKTKSQEIHNGHNDIEKEIRPIVEKRTWEEDNRLKTRERR